MRIFSVILYLVVFINTLLLAYGFRDFSFQLSGMFLFTVLGLPLSSYFYLTANPKAEQPVKLDEDECEVIGKFSI
tara:strand:+ start:1146 stop:1370 length:225 start_codon:yes stop_codon:yes gene_type:complete